MHCFQKPERRMVLFMTRHPIPEFLRFCPKTEFAVGRLRFVVSHPFAKSANGWGTERLWQVGNRRIGVPGLVLRTFVLMV